MRPDCIQPIGFIRGHCGSVANEAPSDRATGAQRPFLSKGLSVHLEVNGTRFRFHYPAGQAFPSGTGLLRMFHP